MSRWGSSEHLEGAEAGDRLNPADARRDRRFRYDLEEAQFAGGFHMGAAAELHRVIGDFNDPYPVAVFFREEGHGPFLAGGLEVFLGGGYRQAFHDLMVDDHLDLGHLGGRDRFKVGEVKPDGVFVDQLARLVDMVAQHLAEGRL